MNPKLVSMNHLERPMMGRTLTHEELHPEYPIAIKKNLELDELDKNLFPTLVTGVRWWPFLCLAMRCTTERNVFVITRKLKRAMGTARMGPEKNESLRAYLSMAKNIEDNPQSSKLCDYLKNRKFDGMPSFFKKHQKNWKQLFKKANGKPAIGYVKAYHATTKKQLEGGAPKAEEVISHILENGPSKYNPVLWQGAFSYALLRCLFGHYDKGSKKVLPHPFVLEWKQSLQVILKTPPNELPSGARNPVYFNLLDLITDGNQSPPLESLTKQFREQERPVLAALRIPLFHRLYFNPTPRGVN